MVFAGGLGHFHGVVEGIVPFRGVLSSCQTSTESYFSSIVLLQTVCKQCLFQDSSVFSVYTAGESSFSSDFPVSCCGSPFLNKSLYSKKKKGFDSP